MGIKKYLTTGPFYNITKYFSNPNYSHDNVAFSGMPRKHPYDPRKIIMISDPLSSNTIFYEFKLSDITHAEELSNIVSESGKGIRMVKIWVKKGSVALRYEPFIVQDTINYYNDETKEDEPAALQ